jgi:recombination protein RecA
MWYVFTTNKKHMAADAKQTVLSEALKNIEKQFGKGAIMRMGDNSNVGLVSTFHSGSYVLDIILGG